MMRKLPLAITDAGVPEITPDTVFSVSPDQNHMKLTASENETNAGDRTVGQRRVRAPRNDRATCTYAHKRTPDQGGKEHQQRVRQGQAAHRLWSACWV